MTPTTPSPQNIKPLIAAGLAIALAGLMLDTHRIETFISSAWSLVNPSSHKAIAHFRQSCESDIVETAKLSREQLLSLLAVPERDSKEKIRQIVREPYCQLSSINVRAGVEAEREAYPLAFDPSTALVILYENNEYAGYRFKH